MEEQLVSPIVELALRKVVSLTDYNRKASLGWSVEKELEQINLTLATLTVVLSVIEKRQLDHDVTKWLQELKDACYDAEDMLDELEMEDLHGRLKDDHKNITEKVCDLISCSTPSTFRSSIGSDKIKKIKEIREKIVQVADRRSSVSPPLQDIDHDNRIGHREWETVDSFVASDYMGRDQEKKEIIEILKQSSDNEKISVIPVVGIEGLGKTTLAILIYTDESVSEYFDLKIWISVSEVFNEKDIMRCIIMSANNGEIDGTMNKKQLLQKASDVLDNKRYLLVMDDVWNEDATRWNKFKSLLEKGANGSKIIVTTCSDRVASIMSTMGGANARGYHLKGLSREACLRMFRNIYRHSSFEEIELRLLANRDQQGIEKICSGVPLAVKTLGRQHYMTSYIVNAWESIARVNHLWFFDHGEDSILRALKRSYDLFPTELKQCFVYCSLFPKDQGFNSVTLIQFWMAHGLLYSDNQKEEPEARGMRYIDELKSRCFFTVFKQNLDFIYFEMHDFVHDLATAIAQHECLMITKYRRLPLESRRHLSLLDTDATGESSGGFESNQKTRSILFFGTKPNQSLVESCISKSPKLRALDLRNSDMEVLPESIGNLKHLRYLNLTENVKIKKLPNSICQLTCLETLFLGRCMELEELPRDIRNLVNLRMLLLTCKQRRLPKNGIGCLSSLRYLGIGSCYNLRYLFDDIGYLKALRTLVIGNCPKLVSLPRGMKNLKSLENLMIFDREKRRYRNLRMEIDYSLRELNSLQPHLRRVCIDGLSQFHELSEWLLRCSAKTLQWLAIKNCPNFKGLPMKSQENLVLLEVLQILNCPKLSSLPEDMHGLTALKELIVRDCPALTNKYQQGSGDWSKIAHIPKIELDGKVIYSK